MMTVESIQYSILLNIQRAEDSLRANDYPLAISQIKTARQLIKILATFPLD